MILSKLVKILKYIVSLIISYIIPIRRKSIVLWSTYGNNYSCNPRALSEFLIMHPELGFDVYFAFKNGRVSSECKAKILIMDSLEFLYRINTAEFVFTNHRTPSHRSLLWRKRKNQKYIMSWHGSMPLKMIEKDAIDVLGTSYERVAKFDSRNCSLMLSDNLWFTNTIKRAFWYEGEVFDAGVPRNDVFFDNTQYTRAIKKVHTQLGVPDGCLIVLYAPTFRTDHSLDAYVSDWDRCLAAFKHVFNKDVVLITRLHPGMIGSATFAIESKNHKVIDATLYDEMQELLVASDILITDFSSTMFEFALLDKPTFLVASDLYSYDRNLYFPLNSLPFRKYISIDDLVNELPYIDLVDYVREQGLFLDSTFSPKRNSNASELLAAWMISHSK